MASSGSDFIDIFVCCLDLLGLFAVMSGLAFYASDLSYRFFFMSVMIPVSDWVVILCTAKFVCAARPIACSIDPVLQAVNPSERNVLACNLFRDIHSTD